MIKAVLFDLDDTLLGNHMDTFIPSYFQLISQHAEPYLPGNIFLQELMIATQAMMSNLDPAVTNREAFWQMFQQRNGMDPQELEPVFHEFYLGKFEELAGLTQFRPSAAPLVEACMDQQLEVVIATNPMFPKVAVDARLRWAGLPVDTYDFRLVTTYETSHATKPHQAYYQEVLDEIGCAPQHAIMVGDDWERDIVPASDMGLFTYWISQNGDAPPDEGRPTAFGTLKELRQRVDDGWLSTLSG